MKKCPHVWLRTALTFLCKSLVQLLSHIHLFATAWTAAQWASPSFTTSWSLLKFMSIELVMLSNQLTLYLYCILSYARVLCRISDVQLCATYGLQPASLL